MDNFQNENSKNKPKEIMQIYFVGPSYVGKTALVNRIVSNNFVRMYYPTSGIIKYHINVDIGDGEEGHHLGKVPVIVVSVQKMKHRLILSHLITHKLCLINLQIKRASNPLLS